MTVAAQLDLFGSPAASPPVPAKPLTTRQAVAPHRTQPQRSWKTALGISVGDLVRTSYHTGPYEVWSIYGPRWWETNYSGQEIYLWRSPVINLTCVLPGVSSPSEDEFFWLNTIYRRGDQWITAGGDEIYVQAVQRPGQVAMVPAEPSPWETPYPRMDGVDYEDRGRVFTCWEVGAPGEPASTRCCDFNGDREVTHRSMGRVWGAASCPRCGRPVAREIVVISLPELKERRP